jgi:predicted transcriptional regulator
MPSITTTVKAEEEAERTEGSTTVRVSQRTHAKLRQLAQGVGRPISTVLEEAVERYRREVFLHGANDDYARLRADPGAWADELAERRVVEGALKDGLEPEEWSEGDFVRAEEAESR